MASSNDFFTSSPTVVLPPNQPNGYFTGPHYAEPNATDGTQAPNRFANPFTPGGTALATTPGSLAGRKRSRGDIHAPEDEDEGLGDGSVDTLVTEAPVRPRGKPIPGPGMTLIYPEDPSYTALAESQSGTWVEENNQIQQFQLNHTKRPSISTRKSQRVGGGGGPGSDDLAQLVLPAQMREVTSEPLIDEATRVLGISWTRMDSTEALRINQAAYSKLIQRHYPALKDVTIWFENSAIPCYLVKALNAYSDLWEFFIFSHDLKEARLVTTDPTQLVPRLRLLPAIELAAPGGTMYAVPDPATATLINGTSVQNMMSEDDHAIHGGNPNVHYTAHEMEVD